MSFVRVVFEKREREVAETPEEVFSHVQGAFSFLAKSGCPITNGTEVKSQKSEVRSAGQRLKVDGVAGATGFSYLGFDPFLICSSRDGVTRLRKRRDFFEWKKSPVEQIFDGDPLEVLRGIFRKVSCKEKLPVPFFGGAFGFFSYDFGVQFEGVKQRVFDDLEIPDFVFGFYDKVVAFDHETEEIYFFGLGETDLQARRKVQELKKNLEKPVPITSDGEVGELSSNLTFFQYEAKISEIQELLRAGETYQVNFSQRFSAHCTRDPWKIFQKTSVENPAPFSCYFDADDFQIISASPELLVRKRGAMVETWPIKGTVEREVKSQKSEVKSAGQRLKVRGVAGATGFSGLLASQDLSDFSFEDRVQISQLLGSEKDLAELSMIVDLERNDLGKVCVPGSVKVEGHREIQALVNVFHTFSRVIGKLGSKYDVFDLFRAIFPGGSITGCPKKRTMEIIGRLEDFRRGVYTGSAGFINFAGDADFNILIRTMLRKNEQIFFHAGGGIVIDSDARKEYEETLAKAKGLL